MFSFPVRQYTLFQTTMGIPMTGPRTQRVLNFLKNSDIAIRPRSNKVTIDIDRSCDMARVKVNSKLIMMGNFWDFHPGCHGFDLPDFRGHESLADVFVSALEANQSKVTLTVNENWVYRD